MDFLMVDIITSFYMSESYKEKQFFETWQKLALNPNTLTVKYYDDYVEQYGNL